MNKLKTFWVSRLFLFHQYNGWSFSQNEKSLFWMNDSWIFSDWYNNCNWINLTFCDKLLGLGSLRWPGHLWQWRLSEGGGQEQGDYCDRRRWKRCSHPNWGRHQGIGGLFIFKRYLYFIYCLSNVYLSDIFLRLACICLSFSMSLSFPHNPHISLSHSSSRV